MSKIDRIDDLATFMKRRQNIHILRKSGCPAPWTNDVVLQTGWFCNVFREQDDTTIWIEENIRKPYVDHANLWFMLCIARYVNWPPTLQAMMSGGGWPVTDDWGPALMTTVLPELIAEIVVGRLWEDRADWQQFLEGRQRLEVVWRRFQLPRYKWGAVRAYEVVSDMRHTRYLSKATDIMTWASATAGAIRGLNRMQGRDVAIKLGQSEANLEMYRILMAMNADKELWSSHWKRLEMCDIQQCLCEFDKYERVRCGEYHTHRRFDAGKSTSLLF